MSAALVAVAAPRRRRGFLGNIEDRRFRPLWTVFSTKALRSESSTAPRVRTSFAIPLGGPVWVLFAGMRNGWQNSSPTAKFRRSFEAGHATRPQIAEHAGEPDGWLAPCPGIDPARRRPPRFGVRERQARASPDYAAAVNVDCLLAVQRSSYAAATPGLSSAWPEEKALGRDGLAALLDRHRYCVLATSRADGRAHAAPVAFLVHDGAFWFATVSGLKLRNLEAHRWASLVVMEEPDRGETESRPHIALTAEGPITLHALDDWRSIETDWLRRHERPPTWAAALVDLRPARLFSYAAS